MKKKQNKCKWAHRKKIGIPYEAIDDHFFCSTEDLDNENKWTDCVACYDSNLRIKAIQTLNKQH